MTSTHFRAGALACALLASTALANPALAQVTSPTFRQLDENGVDLVQGDLVASFTEGTIGSGEGAIGLMRRLGAAGSTATQASQWDSIFLTFVPGNGTFVDFGTRHDKFPGAEARGSTLSGSGGSYQYATPDGTVIAFTNNEPENEASVSNLCRSGSTSNCILLPTSIISPDGKVVTLEYDFWQMCVRMTPPGELPSPDDPLNCTFTPRLAKVSNSFGYEVRFSYATSSVNPNQNPSAAWRQRTGAQFFNNNVSTAVPQASVSYAHPSAGVTDITDIGGRVWRLTGNDTTVALRRPGAGSDTTSYNLSSGKVTSATIEGVTTSYSRSVAGSTVTMTVTNALSQQMVVTSNTAVGRPGTITDPLGRASSFQYDGSGRLTRTTMPEGNFVQLTYDGRGNVTETRAVAKSGSGLADIVTTASFDATCANFRTCNKPNSTTDARGKVTDYSYDATHGGVLTVTAPAATSGGTRPQTRYSYTLTNGEHLLTGMSSCATGSAPSCIGTADEVKSSISYDANGNVLTSTSGNGNGTLTATSAMTYDAMGNLLTVDGPLAGADDIVRHRYNAARERIGTVLPDPDGAGPLKHRATRNTYVNGLLTRQEQGTVNSQSDADWAAFSILQEVRQDYDANARPIISRLVSGETAHQLTQTSYDAVGRPECVATRMNSAIFGSLPASACTLGTQGSFGPDRIVRTVYDAAGQVTLQQVAVGTADAVTEATFTYTANGKLQTLKDAENNLTTYEYDGHDRLSKTRFPVAAKGAGVSSTTDFEQLGYDAASNITSRRLRDGQSIGFAYDDLGRVTFKDLPGSEPDCTYAYDLIGRITSASQPGHALSFTYDALGRQTSETGPLGTVTRQFDPAGRRTGFGTTVGFVLSYQRLVTGEMKAILDSEGTTLATFTYDDLGRRTGLSRVFGTSTSYGYDPVSRLSSLSHDFAGTANDVSWTFAYNPAGQIVSSTRSNDAYAWTGSVAVNRPYSSNGLNQLTQSGSIVPTYDSKGNLTSAGGTTYSYSSENMLTSASGGVTLTYDPLGRLYQSNDGAAVRRFQYDIGESGIYEAISEFDASSLRHFHAFGPGVDEPIVWWDLTQSTIGRLLHADERGSIVAVSDTSASPIAINSYDEYGIPGPTNAGRFLYTGQLWLPELGLQYSKARIYSPTLGRFLQTDPIGYEGGMNMYAYVHNDPIGRTDPSGMIDRSGISGDDMSRFIDFTPQGSGFSSGHSYDWMGQAATFTSGRIDSQILTNASSAWFKLNRLSERSGVDVGCLLTCSNAAIAATIPQSQGTADILTRAYLDGNEIVVTGGRPKLAQNQIPPGQFGLLEWMWEQHKAGARQIRRDVEERCSGDINGGQVVVDGATGAMKSGATAIVRGRPPVPSAARGGAFGVTKSLYTQKCGGR